jgi:thioredoxin:protein disulfide reductase
MSNYGPGGARFLRLLFVILALFSFPSQLWAEEARFKMLTPALSLKPGQSAELKIDVRLPSGFHLYADQLKLVRIDPAEIQMGQLRVSPEADFFDRHSQRNRKGLYEEGAIFLQIEAPLTGTPITAKFDLRYQICSKQICYLPKNHTFEIALNKGAEGGATPSSSTGFFDKVNLGDNLALSFLIVFLAGVLTSFTPCIFPMIPITLSVLGHDSQSKTRKENFLRALMYVLGIATTYSILGVIAGLTGALFGNALANNYVLAFLVIVFVLMALSMWGVFSIEAPATLRQRFGGAAGDVTGWLKIYLVGLFAGIVASPCVGPVLVSILSYVSTTQNAVLGFSLLFTYALGLGLIFIALGLFSELLKLLPRSGRWLNSVKFILGLIMLLTAVYYGQFLYKNLSGAYIHKQVDVTSTTSQAVWQAYSETGLAEARAKKKPVIIDFFAEWCAACHELKEKTFSRPEFIAAAMDFELFVLDATEDSDVNQALLAKYGVRGLPTVMFLNANGQIESDLSFTQFLEWSEVEPKMKEALQRSKK